MKKLLRALLLTLIIACPTWADSFVVHLGHTTDDLHAASMAVKVASVAAQSGQDVVLFLDREGVRLVDQRQPLDLQWGGSTPLDVLYENAVASGVKVVVCPHCAQAVGLEEAQLRKGASILDAQTMAEMLVKADKIMDY